MKIQFKNLLDTITSFLRNDATSPRTWQFPDRSGTVKLTTDNRFLVAVDFNTVVIPSTLTEEIAYSLLIPANTLKVDDILSVAFLATKTGGNQNFEMRLRLSADGLLAGATQVAANLPGSSTAWTKVIREFYIKTTSSMFGFSTINTSNSDVVTNGSAASTTAVDWTIDQYMLFTVEPNSLLDSISGRAAYIEVIRKN